MWTWAGSRDPIFDDAVVATWKTLLVLTMIRSQVHQDLIYLVGSEVLKTKQRFLLSDP